MTFPILYHPEMIGFVDWQPYGSNRELLDRVQSYLVEYEQYLPVTVRQAYYHLVGNYAEYPKTQAFYNRLVTVLSRARRAKMISFSAIRDDGISEQYCGYGYNGLDSFKESILERAKDQATYYSRDKSIGQPRQIVASCEAAGMLPQITKACRDLPVLVRASGGMDSLTAKRQLAQVCTVPTTILQIGDFDPTGLSIYHQLYHDIPAMAAHLSDDEPDIQFDRITILNEHVAQYGLLTGEIKKNDACKSWYPGLQGNRIATCEVEALAPDDLSNMVRSAVENHLDMDAYTLNRSTEKVEQQQAVEAVSTLSYGEAF